MKAVTGYCLILLIRDIRSILPHAHRGYEIVVRQAALNSD